MTTRRLLPTLTLTLLAGGCAASAPGPTSAERPQPPAFGASAAALAFTPPVAYEVADTLGLDRGGRRQDALGEYESVVISETYVRQDDRQYFGRFGGNGDYSQFERRAVSTRVTVGGR